MSETVDKAVAWDALNAAYQRGFEAAREQAVKRAEGWARVADRDTPYSDGARTYSERTAASDGARIYSERIAASIRAMQPPTKDKG